MDVYCPWDVISYCDDLLDNPDAEPKNYWSNTSSNDVVRHFIETLDAGMTKREMEVLIAGESVTKEIHEELTYNNLYDSMENIWSVLFMTGYLTYRGTPSGSSYPLVIPNMEIRNIYKDQIMEMFVKNVAGDGAYFRSFCDALKSGDAPEVDVRSNRESGDGFSDISIEIEDEGIGIIIEVKYAEKSRMEEVCREALRQIETTGYAEQLREDDCNTILKYGIACYKKQCRVMVETEKRNKKSFRAISAELSCWMALFLSAKLVVSSGILY